MSVFFSSPGEKKIEVKQKKKELFDFRTKGFCAIFGQKNISAKKVSEEEKKFNLFAEKKILEMFLCLTGSNKYRSRPEKIDFSRFSSKIQNLISFRASTCHPIFKVK